MLTVVFETGITIIITLAIRCALLDSCIVEFELGLERKGTRANRVLEAARIDKLCIRVHAWGLRRIVPSKERR
jgi:hypothetical protein